MGPMRKAVLTYIIAGYDELKEPDIVTPGWDYFCVSDAPIASQTWRPLPVLPSCPDTACPKRHASFVKIMHHLYLPAGYDVCITIDGSMRIRCDLDSFLGEVWSGETDMAIARHPLRNCLYDEAAAVAELRFDDRALVDSQTARYRGEGFPRNYGLYGARLIVKNNRSVSLQNASAIWARELLGGSRPIESNLCLVAVSRRDRRANKYKHFRFRGCLPCETALRDHSSPWFARVRRSLAQRRASYRQSCASGIR